MNSLHPEPGGWETVDKATFTAYINSTEKTVEFEVLNPTDDQIKMMGQSILITRVAMEREERYVQEPKSHRPATLFGYTTGQAKRPTGDQYALAKELLGNPTGRPVPVEAIDLAHEITDRYDPIIDLIRSKKAKPTTDKEGEPDGGK